MSTLRVASTQFSLRAETSVETIIEHMGDLVGRAAAQGAELIVFPELASTGLLGSISDHDVTTKTITSDYWNVLPTLTDVVVDASRRLAEKHEVTLLAGSHNRVDADGFLRNTAYLIHPDGRVEEQDKIHLTPPEHDLGTRGGDDLLVTKVGPFTVGVLICADIEFPELSRYLVSQGVDLILCPSLTWNRRGLNRVRIGCQARAMENQLYVVMSPLIGHNGLPLDAPMHAVGKALVTGPIDKAVGANDGILVAGENDTEDFILADLDPELLEVSRSRPEVPGLSLRRLDLFAELAMRPTSTD